MSYVNDERLADDALQWWQRYPDSVQALVSMLDDTASDEHGNVLGNVSWSHENGLEITLAGSNGLLYSTRKAHKDDGWHVFHLAADEKELQKRLKRRLQGSNEAVKMNTHSNETGNTTMSIITLNSATEAATVFKNVNFDKFVQDSVTVNGQAYTLELSDEDIQEITELMTKRCKLDTKIDFKQALSEPKHIASYSILERLAFDADYGWHYVAGQNYVGEIKTVRNIILK